MSDSGSPLGGFGGWVGIEEAPEAARDRLSGMGRALARWPGTVSTELGRRAAVVGAAGASPVKIERVDGYLVALTGRPRLSSAPGGAGRDETTASPSALLSAFRRDGERFLEQVRGAFALAIVAEDGTDALLALDRVGGRHPLAYAVRGAALVFGTDVAAIQAHPLSRSPIDAQALYDYLHQSVISAPRTIRRDVRLLEPGTWIRFRGGLARVERYWRPRYLDRARVELAGLSEEYRELIRGAVGRHAWNGSVGSFLSGGTDSSTVAGVLGQVTSGPPRTYSIGFGTSGYDELAYARAAARHFRARAREYTVKPEDLVQWIPRVARAYAEPFGNASALPTFLCARMAREDGVERMLAGDGGDELFGGNERYAKQKVFELYSVVPALLRRRVLDPLLLSLPPDFRIAPLRKARSYVEQANIPMPRRLDSYNVIARTGAENFIHPELLPSIDPDEPRRHWDEIYAAADAASLVNRMLALDLQITLADNDLPKVSRMCELAGVEVAYPFLEDEMIEFSLRVPARLKLKGFRLRWFQKYAMRDFLPEETLRKKKQGFGLPFGVWLAENDRLREFVDDSLRGIKRRGVVRENVVDDLLQRHASEHAKYYGVMIWVLMMLEQWYRAHEDAPAPAR